jgi:hypothetical protein
MQALLAEHAWDWTAALAALQRFILAGLGDPEAIVVLDETAELKKGTATVGVGRQHAGITGQVENCQTVVFAAYVTARAHALFDFRLYLPKQWCQYKKRGSGRTSLMTWRSPPSPRWAPRCSPPLRARASRSTKVSGPLGPTTPRGRRTKDPSPCDVRPWQPPLHWTLMNGPYGE